MYAQQVARTVSRPLLADAHAPLLPFLYHTKTIYRSYAIQGPGYLIPSEEEVNAEMEAIKERWSSPSKNPKPSLSQRRSMAESRPRKPKLERIPFEGSTGSANPDERFETTTMTPRELRVFEHLFRQGIKAKPHESKTQFIKRTQHDFPDLLRPLAEEAEDLRQQAMLEAQEEDDVGQMKVKAEEFEIKDKQFKLIKRHMDDAQTDIDLFRILESDVFAGLRACDEDGHIDSAKYAALPALLQHYIKLIDKHFPASPLGLVLLPGLRKLGPSAFALGASTELYNLHMRMLWQKYTDVDSIVDILTEMDKEVYSFNDDTLELLEQIFEHAAAARRGDLGLGRRAIWSTDRKERALAKLRRWTNTVDERSQAAALREARKFETVLEDEEDGNEALDHAAAAQ